jgi:hypothetical protein
MPNPVPNPNPMKSHQRIIVAFSIEELLAAGVELFLRPVASHCLYSGTPHKPAFPINDELSNAEKWLNERFRFFQPDC